MFALFFQRLVYNLPTMYLSPIWCYLVYNDIYHTFRCDLWHVTYPFKADDICYTCYIVCYGESRLAPPYSLKMLTYWPLSAKLNSWCPRMFNFMCYDPGQGKTWYICLSLSHLCLLVLWQETLSLHTWACISSRLQGWQPVLLLAAVLLHPDYFIKYRYTYFSRIISIALERCSWCHSGIG